MMKCFSIMLALMAITLFVPPSMAEVEVRPKSTDLTTSWPTRTGHVRRAMRDSLGPIHLLAIKNAHLDMKCTPITCQEPGVFLARPAVM